MILIFFFYLGRVGRKKVLIQVKIIYFFRFSQSESYFYLEDRLQWQVDVGLRVGWSVIGCNDTTKDYIYTQF